MNTVNLAPSIACSSDIENVLPFYLSECRAGKRVCLVSLVNVMRVSPRPLGSQMAVSEDGRYMGFITGGCAEAAIVKEATAAIHRNKSLMIRIGENSPWMDIRLPCGSGIDLLFSVADHLEVLEQANSRIVRRESVSVRVELEPDRIEICNDPKSTRAYDGNFFVRNYSPETRLLVVGSGPYVAAAARLASSLDMNPSCWAPDDLTLNQLRGRFEAHKLKRTNFLYGETFDRWTAAVLFFHEHDWEPPILEKLLATDCFYIGALGSRIAHYNRVADLKRRGIPQKQIERISGPAGIPIQPRTPSEIAVSILSEIILAKNELPNHEA